MKVLLSALPTCEKKPERRESMAMLARAEEEVAEVDTSECARNSRLVGGVGVLTALATTRARRPGKRARVWGE